MELGKDVVGIQRVSKEAPIDRSVKSIVKTVSLIVLIVSFISLAYVICNIAVMMEERERESYLYYLQENFELICSENMLLGSFSKLGMLLEALGLWSGRIFSNIAYVWEHIQFEEFFETILKNIGRIFNLAKEDNPIRILITIWAENFVRMFEIIVQNCEEYWEMFQEVKNK